MRYGRVHACIFCVLLSFLAFSLFVSCGSNSAGSATVTLNVVSRATTSRALADFATNLSRWSTPDGLFATGPDFSRSSAGVGQTSSTSLTSLQYYIQTISMCQNITINGTGYSGTTGCTDLYSNTDSSATSTSTYNNYVVSSAIADTNENHYIDFMTEAGRAKINKAATVTAGTYNFVLINFMRPIKMKAEFLNGSGTATYFTKTTTSGLIVDAGTDDGGRKLEYVRPATTKTSPAETMTYMLNNGGTFVPLSKPFVVAAGDNVYLDFAFNPANFATVTESASCSSSTQAVADLTNCTTFDLPYAKMAPVPRKSGETTRKETYLVDYITSGSQKSKVRIELYYNSADTDKTIRALDSAVVMDSTATSGATNVVQSYKATETSNVVTIYSYNSTSGQIDAEGVTGLIRRTNGSVSLKCLFVGGPCSSADGSTLTRSYTYEGDAVVSN